MAVCACRVAVPELLNHRGAAIVLTSTYSMHAQKPELIAHDHEEQRRDHQGGLWSTPVGSTVVALP